MKARLSWDTGLLMAVRSLEIGGRRAVALLPPGGIAARRRIEIRRVRGSACRSGGWHSAARLLARRSKLRA